MTRTRTRARPRVIGLPLTGQQPQRILEANESRRGLLFYNDGTGTVWLTDDPSITNSDLMFPVPAGASLSPGQGPFAPENATFASADAGHSLRIWELFTEMDPGAPAPAPRRASGLLRGFR